MLQDPWGSGKGWLLTAGTLLAPSTFLTLCKPLFFCRLSTIVGADQILVLKDGRIAERGR